MERIRDAISKARAVRGLDDEGDDHVQPIVARVPSWMPAANSRHGWRVEQVEPDPLYLEQQRVISFAKADPNHIAFDLLRTRTLQAMQDNNWRSLLVTSPDPSCGKTTVTANLAFSLGRQKNCRTVLIDLDLRRPRLAKTIGVQAPRSLHDYLRGEAALEECFVAVGDNLYFGLNTKPVSNAAEVLQQPVAHDIYASVMRALNPTIVIFDLPPVLTCDDVQAFLPQVDCSLLVAAVGKTTAKAIDESEHILTAGANYLGVVLNMSRERMGDYYHYATE